MSEGSHLGQPECDMLVSVQQMQIFRSVLLVLLQEPPLCAQNNYNMYVGTCHASNWQVPASGWMATETEHDIIGC
jgi:hypothetical protein